MVYRTVNVGIKSTQKEEIDKILRESEGKYKSINEFVQASIDQFLLKQKVDEDVKEIEDIDQILYDIKEFVEKILEDELEDKIAITSDIAETIQRLLEKLKEFKMSLNWDDRTAQLISAIRLKDSINELKESCGKNDKKYPRSKIPRRYSEKIDDFRNKFVELMKVLRKMPGK